jgi:hypothetical protein
LWGESLLSILPPRVILTYPAVALRTGRNTAVIRREPGTPRWIRSTATMLRIWRRPGNITPVTSPTAQTVGPRLHFKPHPF